MKKRLLVLISIAIIFAMMVTACDKNEEVPDVSASLTESAVPSASAPILQEDMSKYGIVLNKTLIREANYTQYPYIQEWQDYINDSYNIDIKINFVQTGFQYFTDYYLQNREDLNLTGIVYLSDFRGYNDLQKLIDYEAILPLTDYLKDNTVFNKSADEFKNMYKLNDGEIWAVPGEIRYNGYTARIYNTEWLLNVGAELPTNYSELLSVSRMMKEDDPDGDSKNNTYGLSTKNDYTFGGLQDLFTANGVYLGEDSDYSTAYNPTTQTYEDGMLNDNVYDVLTYIRSLLDEDLIDYYGYSSGVTYGKLRKSSASIAAYAYDALPEHSYTTIRESQQDAVSLINYSTTAYVMLANTVNSDEMINNFVSTFLGDIDAHEMLRFGMPGVSYEEEGYNVILKDEYKKNIDLLPRVIIEMSDPELLDPAKMSPLYGTQMTPIFYEQPYYVFYNEYDQYLADYQEKALVEAKQYFDDNQSLFYDIPLLNKGFTTTFSVNGSMFSDVAKKTYENIISVEDIIAEYQKDAKYFNVLEQLDQINAQLGLQTKYLYDD